MIVGGGPAGLTAALALSRYRHRTIVAESPAAPRNAASRGVHGLIGLWRVPPRPRAVRGPGTTWTPMDWRSAGTPPPPTSPRCRRADSVRCSATARRCGPGPSCRPPASWTSTRRTSRVSPHAGAAPSSTARSASAGRTRGAPGAWSPTTPTMPRGPPPDSGPGPPT
ncbi:FAD-binding protein [Streptomyces cucumeris]|uniref:FAD-binding protein n=1 Tax=Streptomyces cucumeris TaxID=2962890 RepID=UPI003D72DE49